ncbi:hypothetical protein W822_19920 [Advenella kashmirensis W13003]|uniref:Uncharacterized protein n=1 Tax=Advenella kashmirensis W13003 TaxID=1424334 RepID=V8QNK7_9BURK|nr:hypothetical protein [Advenella kashmirensis]ETF00923.1 hypothetical protein W822_19920 [Advenella kashmirensis W13003]
MKQFPLTRTDLIKIRDTNKSEQVRVLLREISRLHQVMRSLNIQVERIRIAVANGRAADDIIFDAAERILEHEMRLYGPPPFDYKRDRKQAQLEASEKLIDEALKREANVRKNQTGK